MPSFPDLVVKAKYATEHRCGIVISGPGLSDEVSGTDPLKDNLPLQVTAALLVSLLHWCSSWSSALLSWLIISACAAQPLRVTECQHCADSVDAFCPVDRPGDCPAVLSWQDESKLSLCDLWCRYLDHSRQQRKPSTLLLWSMSCLQSCKRFCR